MVRLGPYREDLDSYGHVCRRGVHVNEGDQWPHWSPDNRRLCCDQAVVAWPHPCPWHPGVA